MLGKTRFKLGMTLLTLLLLVAAIINISVNEISGAKELNKKNSAIVPEISLSGDQPEDPSGDSTAQKTSTDNDLDQDMMNYIIKSEEDYSEKDKSSPSDWIKESQIKVYDDKVVIEIEGAQWARFTDTKSMDPVLDSDANAIEIVPKSAESIHVGDIISFNTEYTDGTIIHRVIEKGTDEDGIYFITKGDNNANADPGKVRFSQVQRLLVAIIY